MWAGPMGFPRPDLGIWHDEWVSGASIRYSYYTSLTGSDEDISSVKDSLWSLGFHAEVFKKRRVRTKPKASILP